MQNADVRIYAGMRERDAEAGWAYRRLRQSGALLRRGRDEAGMHAVGRRIDDGVKGAIFIHRDIGRRRDGILWLRAKRHRMRG